MLLCVPSCDCLETYVCEFIRHCNGVQNWEFNEKGYMQVRDACINKVPIEQSVRRLQGWEIHDDK